MKISTSLPIMMAAAPAMAANYDYLGVPAVNDVSSVKAHALFQQKFFS